MWQDKLSQAGYTEETAPPPIKKEINGLAQFQSETDGIEKKMKRDGISNTETDVLLEEIKDSKDREQKQGITIENKIDSYMKHKPHYEKMQQARNYKKAATATAPPMGSGGSISAPAPAPAPAQVQQLQMQEESGGGGVWFWAGLLGLGALAYFGINKK